MIDTIISIIDTLPIIVQCIIYSIVLIAGVKFLFWFFTPIEVGDNIEHHNDNLSYNIGFERHRYKELKRRLVGVTADELQEIEALGDKKASIERIFTEKKTGSIAKVKNIVQEIQDIKNRMTDADPHQLQYARQHKIKQLNIELKAEMAKAQSEANSAYSASVNNAKIRQRMFRPLEGSEIGELKELHDHFRKIDKEKRDYQDFMSKAGRESDY